MARMYSSLAPRLALFAGCLLAAACVGARARAADAAASDDDLPLRLSETGLFVPGSLEPPPGVLAFSPQYPLWSDGAAKRRWIALPPGTSIDAAAIDAWDFPRGTRFWKEFSHEGAIETRYIERRADGAWRFASYVWNAEGTDALLAPAEGVRAIAVRGAAGSRYIIPSRDDCRACHEAAPVPVLGFSALQLSPDRDGFASHAEANIDGVDLPGLVARGLLSNLDARWLATPPRIAAASPTERAALGYLHGNCGHCHNAEGPLAPVELNLAQRLGDADASGAVRASLIAVPSQFRVRGAPAGSLRVTPGASESSVLLQRMRSRDPLQQMPPLGSAVADDAALALIARWIDQLPQSTIH
jgi:hypothetical protein